MGPVIVTHNQRLGLPPLALVKKSPPDEDIKSDAVDAFDPVGIMTSSEHLYCTNDLVTSAFGSWDGSGA